MWQQSFLTFTNLVTYGLLCKGVLPKKAAAFERVSAAIAVRAALRAKSSEQTLLFLVPDGTSSTARYITAGLLAGNHGHANGAGQLPPDEVCALLKGNVLLVTPAVSECRTALDELLLGGNTPISDLWDVLPLSRYYSRLSAKPVLLLANPGWAQAGMVARRFAAVIIDATHPRTLARLPTLLSAAKSVSALRIVVAPPLGKAALDELGYPSKADVWLWDPQAIADAEQVTDTDEKPRPLVALPTRTLWLCDGDKEADDSLKLAYQCLADVTKQSTNRAYPGLRLTWSILNRLRQTTVPLAQLDQAAASTWAGGIRKKVESLKDISGSGDALWDSTWPRLRDSVETAYRVFLQRYESSKFWGLASRLAELLREAQSTLRVVVPTVTDGDLLVPALEAVVDGLSTAIADGRLEIVTQSEEARAIANGQPAHTLLLGIRPSYYRYLDVFPSQPTEEFLYPFEHGAESASLARLYSAIEKLNGTVRPALLNKFGIPNPNLALSDSRFPKQPIAARHSDGHPVSLVTSSSVSPHLDLDAIAGWRDVDGSAEQDDVESSERVPSRVGNVVEVTFADGHQGRYYEGESVDVYFTESDRIHREPVASVQPGWHVITFVDGRYDSLFKSMAEAISLRLPRRERATLELWEKAKAKLLSHHKSKRALYAQLKAAGLVTAYETFTTWFREGEDGVLAPQQFEEFATVAQATGAFSDAELLSYTFDCVKHSRGRNRAAGRKLKALLRAIKSRDGYVEALESARRFDAALADVCAAVDVLEVESVRVISRS